MGSGDGFRGIVYCRGRINPVWFCLAWYSVASTWSGRPFEYVIWSIRDDFFFKSTEYVRIDYKTINRLRSVLECDQGILWRYM